MTNDPQPSDDESTPARRPWFRLHRSTYAVLVVLVIVVALMNVPGQLVISPWIFSQGEYPPGFNSYEYLDHGWPLVYLRRPAYYTGVRSSSLVGQIPWWSIWSLPRLVEEFNGLYLAFDLAVAGVTVAPGAAIYETWRRRRRRIFQLHLIDLFLLTALAAAVLAWLSTQAGEYRKEQQALAKLEHGTYLCLQPGGPTWLRKLTGDRPFRILDRVVDIGVTSRSAAESFRHLKRFDNAWEDDLSCLEYLPRLEALDLSLGVPKDSQLVHLRHCRRLKGLNLCGANVADEGLAHLVIDPRPPYVERAKTEISDEGLAHLAGLSKLQVLSLNSTSVTNAGLTHLEALGSLEYLDLRGTKVTETGLTSLQKALPGCSIVHNLTSVSSDADSY